MNALKTVLTLLILFTISACKQPQPKVITVATENTTNDKNIENKNTNVSYIKSEFNIETFKLIIYLDYFIHHCSGIH